MQRYQILKLSAIIANVTFIFKKNPQTGFYDPVTTGHTGTLPTRKSIMDFIGMDGVESISVLRTRDNFVFSTGDNININNQSATIKHIMFKEGTVMFGYGPSNLPFSYVTMESATLYVPPTPARIPPPASAPRRATVTGSVTLNTTNDATSQNIAQLEAQLVARWDRENPERIRLSQTMKRRRETLHEFLIEFFENWNQPTGDPAKQTVYVNSGAVQTINNKRRSLGDLYMICKYYYPTMTLTELLRELYTTLPQHFRTGFRTSICSQIHKRVWYYSSGSDNQVANSMNPDEYNHNVSWYTDNIR